MLILLCGGQTDQELTREIAILATSEAEVLTESLKSNPLPNIIAP